MGNEEKLKKLEHKRNKFRINRNYSLLAVLYLAYSFIKDVKDAPIYFYIIMPLIILGLIALNIYVRGVVKKIDIEIEKLNETIDTVVLDEVN